MEKLKVWSKAINTKIDEQQEKLYRTDYKFFKLDTLEKVSVKVDEFSDSCEHCKSLKQEIESLVDKIPELINGSPGDRQFFEKKNSSFMKHLKKTHGIVQPSYYLSVYTFIGIMAGLAIGGAVSYITDYQYFTLGLMLGFSIGILTGRIYGKILDQKKKESGLVLE